MATGVRGGDLVSSNYIMSANEDIEEVLYNLTISEIEHALGDLRAEYSARVRRHKETFVREVFRRGFGSLLLDEVARNSAAQSGSAWLFRIKL